MTNHRAKWSNGDLETLAQLRAERKTVDEIAVHLGRTSRAVCQKIGKARIRSRWHWTEAEDAKLRFARMQGVRYKAIALELGRSPAACMVRASALGITT